MKRIKCKRRVSESVFVEKWESIRRSIAPNESLNDNEVERTPANKKSDIMKEEEKENVFNICKSI